MPYYPKINILFIHIPKTGGTVTENQLRRFSEQYLYTGHGNRLLPAPHNKNSLQHQFYDTIIKYNNIFKINLNNIKIFSIVRNPYDRIISDLFWYELIKSNDTPEKVYNVIKNNYLNRDDLDNHNIPQYLFVCNNNGELHKNIKIFKTENLNSENDLISNFLGVQVDLIRHYGNKDYSKYLNKDSINIINNYFKKDFVLFNYKMK